MNISTTTRLANPGRDPRKDNVMRQIKKLEAERRRLQKRLAKAAQSAGDGGDGGSSGGGTVSAAAGTSETVAAPVAASQQQGDGSSNTAAAAAQGKSASVSAALQQLAQFSRNLSSSAEEEDTEENLSPKEIMKLLQLVELQIATLQQQLGEDAILQVGVEGLDDDRKPGAAPDGSAAGVEAALEPPVVQDGHVDGYA